MKNLKKSVLLLALISAIIAGFSSCRKSDRYRDPESTDKTKPGVVSNLQVKNYNGAAVISYTLPNDKNLLYVVADYSTNTGVSRQSKASYFLDTIRVEGFHSSKDYTVTLRAVTRANVESDPVTITVHPDTPYYQLIRKSIVLKADFGGVNIHAVNTQRNAIGVNFVAVDPVTNSFTTQDRNFTSATAIDYSVRGFRPDAARFGVYISDEFGNLSDTSVVTLTPLYEEQLNKSLFFNYPEPSDAVIGYGGIAQYLWDGATQEVNGAQPWSTQPGTLGSTRRLQCTFGVGRVYKLSHFLMYFRGYGYDNPKDFTIWGSTANSPQEAVTPGGAPTGTTVGDWTVIGNFRVPDPPSGLPQGQTNSADQAFLNAGVDFNVPFASPSVKYIRIVVKDTWFGLDYTNIREITMYGAPQ